jgi:uncharacterized protein DUF6285
VNARDPGGLSSPLAGRLTEVLGQPAEVHDLRLGPEQERRHRERLAAFAQQDQAGLAAAIRAGVLDAEDPALLAAVRAAVTDRLTVANPRYLSYPA